MGAPASWPPVSVAPEADPENDGEEKCAPWLVLLLVLETT